MSNSHKTAIKRKQLSGPAKYLFEKYPFTFLGPSKWLDYGCGYGSDADSLDIDKYDPHYFPIFDEYLKRDYIMCNFVLNTIPEAEERYKVIDSILSLLKPTGIAFISVRNDKKDLNGWTKKGTWQGYIELNLPVEVKRSSFVMYRLVKPYESKVSGLCSWYGY